MKKRHSHIIIIIIFCVVNSSCNFDNNYYKIKEYFPENAERASKFSHEFNSNTTKDTILVFEKVKINNDKIYYELKVNNINNPKVFNIIIDKENFIVTADSNRYINELHSKQYIRKTKDVLIIPEPEQVDGWYREYDKNDSLKLSIPWPHPYWSYLSFEKNELIIQVHTTFKTDFYSTYYFSKQFGLEKIELGLQPRMASTIYKRIK